MLWTRTILINRAVEHINPASDKSARETHPQPLTRIGTTMDSDHSWLATVVLDTQAFALHVEVIEHLASEGFAGLSNKAKRLRQRYHVADAAFDADDAVQAVLLKIFRALKDAKLNALEEDEELMRLLMHELNQRILVELERERARKRGGLGPLPGGRHSTLHHVDVDLEAIDSSDSAPDVRVSAQDEVEALLQLLDRRDPGLRIVATMKTDGFTHKEIAAHLGVSLPTVDYRVGVIKEVLGRRYPAET